MQSIMHAAIALAFVIMLASIDANAWISATALAVITAIITIASATDSGAHE